MDILWFSIGALSAAVVMLILFLFVILGVFGHGTLLVDTSDPVTDRYRLLIDDLEHVDKKRAVLLSIKKAHLTAEDVP